MAESELAVDLQRLHNVANHWIPIVVNGFSAATQKLDTLAARDEALDRDDVDDKGSDPTQEWQALRILAHRIAAQNASNLLALRDALVRAKEAFTDQDGQAAEELDGLMAKDAHLPHAQPVEVVTPTPAPTE